MHYSDRLKNINPFNPMEIELSPQSGLIGKSLQELNFRKKTGCLIIAIRRKTQVFIAPEPAERLEELDRIVIIGSPESMQNIKTFF